MSDNDTSDEAFDEWYERTKRGYGGIAPGGIYIWREAVRRCEALIELEGHLHREYFTKWMIDHGYATGHGDSIGDLLKQLEWQIEEERRKAFEEGWKKGWSNQFNGWLHTEDEDYRAFKEAQK